MPRAFGLGLALALIRRCCRFSGLHAFYSSDSAHVVGGVQRRRIAVLMSYKATSRLSCSTAIGLSSFDTLRSSALGTHQQFNIHFGARVSRAVAFKIASVRFRAVARQHVALG